MDVAVEQAGSNESPGAVNLHVTVQAGSDVDNPIIVDHDIGHSWGIVRDPVEHVAIAKDQS